MTEYNFPNSRIGFAGRTLPVEARPVFSNPARADQILELESMMGSTLSPDVQAFFETHDSISAMEVHVGYWVGGIETILRSIRRGDFPDSIESHRVFPIGSDGGGNAFLMPVDSDGPVWKWSHAIGEACEVAESFPQFLDRLADDFRMFAAGNDDWPFMAG
jgi:cell wall assembly regulator SMI1